MKADDDYIYKTLNLFHMYSRIGFLGGQIKEKYGTIRWYVHMAPIADLHDIFYPSFSYNQWSDLRRPWVDVLNNVSMMFFCLTPVAYITLKYKILIYNIAYRHALMANPGFEKGIIASCDHIEKIWGAKKLMLKYKRDVK